MDKTSRVAIAIVVGITVLMAALWLTWAALGANSYNDYNCGEPVNTLKFVVCGKIPNTELSSSWGAGERAEYRRCYRCHEAVVAPIGALCGFGAPIWGAIAFAVTLFVLPKSHKES